MDNLKMFLDADIDNFSTVEEVEMELSSREELRLFISLREFKYRRLHGLLKLLRTNKKEEVVVKDYYLLEDNGRTRYRRRHYPYKDTEDEFYLVKGFGGNKITKQITKDEFINRLKGKNVWRVRKDVIVVKDFCGFNGCIELMLVDNKLYFSIEVENENLFEPMEQLKAISDMLDIDPDITAKTVWEYFRK